MKKNTSYVKFLLPIVLLVLIASLVPSVLAQQTVVVDKPYRQFLPWQVAPADQPKWLGPEGGSVTALATARSNANVLYAGTAGAGVFKSTNGGSTWATANKGDIGKLKIDSLAVDPTNSTIVLAGTDGQGVYKSTDGGANWTGPKAGIKAGSLVYALLFNPGNPDLVLAATQTSGTAKGVLYKSTDKGENWTSVLTQTKAGDDWVNALAANPNSPNYMLAATNSYGPYQADSYGDSSDWGKTTISGGEWETGMGVAFDPRSGTNRAYYMDLNGDFYRSTDNGSNWTLEYYGSSGTQVARGGLVVNPLAPDILYAANTVSSAAGVLRSDDMGDNWHSVGLKGKKVNAVVPSVGNSNYVYAATDSDGVYLSTDRGGTWKLSSTGLGSSYVTGVIFTSSTTAYASTYGGGVFKSTNTGASWTPFNTGLTDLKINGLVLHPTSPILYALTSSAGLMRYDLQAGTSWTAASGLPAQLEKPQIALRDDPATALATTGVGVNQLVFAPTNAQIAYLATNGGLYVSSDSGATFTLQAFTNQVVKSVFADPADPNTSYVATATKGVVTKRTLSNGNYVLQELPLPSDQLQQTVNVVAAWPGAAGKFVAGTSNGLWYYNGSAWEAAGLQGQNVTAQAADPFHAGILIAGTTKGAYYSADHKTWISIASSVGALNVASLNFNTFDPYTIYIGTADRGTLRAAYIP